MRLNTAAMTVDLASPRLTAGPATLSFPRLPSGGYGLALAEHSVVWFDQCCPAAVMVVGAGADASETAVSKAYDRVASTGQNIVATATLRTPAGSGISIVDTYRPDGEDAFRLTRQIIVSTVDPHDGGFDSRFGLRPRVGHRLTDYDLFAPGVWYRQNRFAVASAIGADPSLDTCLVKETRLALPLMMIRGHDGGPALTLLHENAAASTGLDDHDPRPQINETIEYGSIGPWTDADGLTLGFCYPGSEGARSYGTPGWRHRWHPVKTGVRQDYALLLHLTDLPDYPEASREAWRFAFGRYAPRIGPAPSTVLYHDGVNLFDRNYRDDFPAGGRGLPFMIFLGLHPPSARDQTSAPLTDRGPSNYHLQSGFVGQQIPAAYLMLRQALIDRAVSEIDRWASVIDFWVRGSLAGSVVPRTDYSCENASWASGPIFLRTLSDGTEAIADAYRVMLLHGQHRDSWLAYLRGVGDWLVTAQSPDGAWARSYRTDGTVADAARFNTTNPLRLLMKLWALTGDDRYLESGRRAGEWSLRNIDAPGVYVGGTPDNPNTIDKEAAVLAFDAFQSLYDATAEPRWLAAAERAADNAESWTYAWSFSVTPAAGARSPTHSPWPACGLVGQSLVATGHSYADMFMAGCSTAYYRLSLQSGDTHYRTFARLLAEAANRPADLTGSLGYPGRGLIEEGVSPADFAATGPGTCLTWCTVAQMLPVADLQDLFGADSIDEVEMRISPERRQELNRNWYPLPATRP